MSNSDDESAAEPHNASISTISLQNVCLPWPNYSTYFKVLRIIDDMFFYKKLVIKCLICVGTKVLKVDTRSRKHLNVSINNLYTQ